MERVIISLIFVIFLSAFLTACESGQIDVNSASKDELKKIVQIGDSRADQILDLRPFSSIDDMKRIVGIGDARVDEIKSQGLACVEDIVGEEVPEDDEPREKEEWELEQEAEGTIGVEFEPVGTNEETVIAPLEPRTISLNPKDIKSDENSEEAGKDYAVYGLVAFSVLIIFLLVLKEFRGGRYKSEFTETNG